MVKGRYSTHIAYLSSFKLTSVSEGERGRERKQRVREREREQRVRERG